MIVDSFVGPSNTLRSINADCDRTINWYQALTAPGVAKSRSYLAPTPGLRIEYLLPTSPVRGLFEMNNRCWAVSGPAMYELYSNGTFSVGQAVADDTNPVSMVSNGTAGFQLMMIGADLGYIWDLNTNIVTQITSPGFPVPARVGEFMDGYFLALKGGGSRSFSWSALEDGTSWDVLDVAERSEAADNISTLIRNHREIWLMGTQTSEVWYDQGDVNNVFAPLQGVFIEVGCTSPWSIIRVDNSLIWMGESQYGSLGVWRADGYTPRRVSTDAVDEWLGKQDVPTDARAWSYRQSGHVFYVLICPRSADTSWVYDVGLDRWHERAHWDPASDVVQWVPYRPGSHCMFLGKHLVGDRLTGAIYHMSPDYYNEQLVVP